MFPDDIVSAAAPARASSHSAKPSPLEEEVVGLFDQLQDRLLRYLMSLGLPAAEGEEIVQETFLALFQHLQRGKPRHNLRGWVFQVAHNLALKQRKATQRNRQNLLEHDWTSAGRAPDFLPNLQKELLAVVGRYVEISDDMIRVTLGNSGDTSLLEINIEIEGGKMKTGGSGSALSAAV